MTCFVKRHLGAIMSLGDYNTPATFIKVWKIKQTLPQMGLGIDRYDILIKECTERIRQLVNFDFHPTNFWAFPGAIDEARIPVDESADGQMPGLTAKSVHSWMKTREK